MKTAALANGLRYALVLALILGIFFRFYHLGHKVIWGDEVSTAIRIAGYGVGDVYQEVYDGQVRDVATLMQFQHPNSERTLSDTVEALTGHPEHSPLYYLLARVWVQGWHGADWPPDLSLADITRYQAVLRSLSAVFSLVAIPAIYWLCWELFQSVRTGWFAMAIAAISPFQVLYGQEARSYSLWILCILLSSAALLRALRLRTWQSWSLYTLTLALGLYSFLFSGLVAIAHAVYVISIERFRLTRQLVSYGIAAIASILLFSPWIWIIISQLSALHENVDHLSQGRSKLVQIWLLNLSRLYFDFNHGDSLLNPLLYVTLGLTVYALYWLLRNTPKSSWLFVWSLIAVPALALIGPDLLLGGQRSGIARYAIPCYVGIQLAVAHVLASQTRPHKDAAKHSRLWQQGAIALLLIGILSNAISAQTPVWWTKGNSQNRNNPAIAAFVNQSDRPLLISDSSLARVFSLSYLLEPDVHLQLVKPTEPFQIPQPFDPIFLYLPSPKLKQLTKKNYQLTPSFSEWLWTLTPRENRKN